MYESVDWSEDGTPHNARFMDRYCSCAGGFAQATEVFMAGCGLPENWRGKDKFAVLETGFGLGLNFLSTWAAWLADPNRSDQLHFCSVEAYPVSSIDIVRAVQAAASGGADSAYTAGMMDLADQLTAIWQDFKPGIYNFWLSQGGVQLTLGIGQVIDILPLLDCQADAVFLDGFSPSVNPEMWSFSTLQAIAAHCNSSTRLATYTVAKSVLENLKKLGFDVAKRKGLPPKRDRLEAVFESP
jgi:tRNA 5-methylaminomethyl-2-thiouridine biosynthesis bifunctional protein